MLFIRGNAISGAPIISGTIQLPKPPIIAGMTMKEDHDQAVCGNDDVEVVGLVEDLQAGIHQLDPDQDREDAADHAGDQREHQVHRADVLVVRRIDKAAPAMRDGVSVVIAVCRVCHRVHGKILRSAFWRVFYSF